MPCDSILEIPNAAASDHKLEKAPYAADTNEALLYQRQTGTPELVTKPRVMRCSSPVFVDIKPGKLNENEPDSDTATLCASGDAVSAGCIIIREASVTSYIPSPSMAVSEMSPATDSIVGWSNRSVYGNSIVNHSARVFANSVAATESSPAAISGKFVAKAVPSTSMSDTEMVVTTEAPQDIIRGSGATARRITLHEFPSRVLTSLPSIVNESAMERSDGWSNSSVDGSSVSRRSLSRVESSVAPTESSPADMSGASGEMAVPVSWVAMPTSSSRRP